MVVVRLRLFRKRCFNARNRITGCSVLRRYGPIKNSPQSLTNTNSGCGLLQPYRLEHAENIAGLDHIDRARSYYREGVVVKRRDPLILVFLVLGRRNDLRLPNLLRRLLKCGGAFGTVALGQRIATVTGNRPHCRRLCSCIGQGHHRSAAQAYITLSTVHAATQYPGLRTGLGNPQIETAAVIVHSGLQFAPNLFRGQLVHSLRPILCPIHKYGIA